MTFKEKAVAELKKLANDEMGPAKNVIRECAELVAGLPDEEHENAKLLAAAPDYEALYKGLQERLRDLLKVNDGMQAEIRMLNIQNARLSGYREAVETIFKGEV